jgi:hypothetical protein
MFEHEPVGVGVQTLRGFQCTYLGAQPLCCCCKKRGKWLHTVLAWVVLHRNHLPAGAAPMLWPC